MLSTNFANFLGESIHNSIFTAGVCELTSISNPKAAAFGTLASAVAEYGAIQVVGKAVVKENLFAFASLMGIKMVAGGTAGRYYDKEFNYSDLCVAYFVTASIGFIATRALGITNLDF